MRCKDNRQKHLKSEHKRNGQEVLIGKDLGWTIENCHFVDQILAIHYNSLLLIHLDLALAILWNSQELFLRDLWVLKHMWPMPIQVWMHSFHTIPCRYFLQFLHWWGETHPLPSTAIQSCAFDSQRIPAKGAHGADAHPCTSGCYLVRPKRSLLLIDLPDKYATSNFHKSTL